MIVSSDRFEGLDLVRGICAVAIVVYHYLAWTHEFVIQSMGTFGVYIFFILSALTMMIRYGEDFTGSITLKMTQTFFVARMARIAPLLILVALAGAAVAAIKGGDFAMIAARAFLTGSALMALNLPGFLSNSVGAWTLGIEAAFYLVFPVLALIVNSVRISTLLLALAIFVLGQQCLILLIAPMADAHWQHYTTPLTFAPFFLIGLIIYRLPTLRGEAGLFWSLLCLGIIFSFSLLIEVDLFRTSRPYLFLTILAGTVIYCAYSARTPVYMRPIAAFLGNISYALYLTHWFTYAAIKRVVGPEQIGGYLHFGIFIIFATLVSWATYSFFEDPARRRIRRWYQSC